jgi:allantoate deiminase
VIDEAAARKILVRCEILGEISEEAGCLTRSCLCDAMRRATGEVADWMRAAGMTVRQDNIGNVIGRYEADRSPARTLILGSHLDTVRDAGKYDGPLGVLIALAAVEHLHERNERLPFAIEVMAFSDEEGLRYHTAYLGSKVVAGTFDPSYLYLTDAAGIPMGEAIRAAGGDPDALAGDKRAATDLLGYCEVHIEQGPVLEAHNLPVGVVTAIAGQSRIEVRFMGQAGHAGTVPMTQRRDALAAAAEFVLAVEAHARAQAGMVATVGQISVRPGASNVIPGLATLSLDVRHSDDEVREQACRQLYEQALRISSGRGVTLGWQVLQETPAAACAPGLANLLTRAIASLGYPTYHLPSGAGHDAVTMADLTSMAMLFVRCRGGVSHNPAESVTQADVGVALAVLRQFLTMLAGAEHSLA